MNIEDAAKALAKAVGEEGNEKYRLLALDIVGIKNRLDAIEAPSLPLPDNPTPVEPTPAPPLKATGFFAREPKADAIRLLSDASEDHLQNTLRTGHDVLLVAGSSIHISKTLRMEADGQLLGVYGAGPRPILEAAPSFRDNQALIDIHESDSTEIQGLHFKGNNKGHVLNYSAHCGSPLVEDCKFESFTSGIHFVGNVGDNEVTIDDPLVHRCIFHDLQNSNTSRHCTGIYAEGTHNLHVEQCVFNGIGTGRPTKFRRAIYIQNKDKATGVGHNTPTTLVGNLFASCAAEAFQLRSGGTVQQNIILWCPVESHATGSDSEFTGNAVLFGASGLYMYKMKHGLMSRNIFAHGRVAADGWRRQAIRMGAKGFTMEDNKFFKWSDSVGRSITDNSTVEDLEGVSPSNKKINFFNPDIDFAGLTSLETDRERGTWLGTAAVALGVIKKAASAE